MALQNRRFLGCQPPPDSGEEIATRILLCCSCIFMLVIWENFQVRNGMSKMDKDRPFRLFPLSALGGKVAATCRCKTIFCRWFLLASTSIQTFKRTAPRSPRLIGHRRRWPRHQLSCSAQDGCNVPEEHIRACQWLFETLAVVCHWMGRRLFWHAHLYLRQERQRQRRKRSP